MVDAAIYSGVPIVLWHRKPGDHPEIEQNIQNLILANDKLQLPTEVHKTRQQHNQDREHWIHNLSILVDDPTRIPPGMHGPKLTMPE